VGLDLARLAAGGGSGTQLVLRTWRQLDRAYPTGDGCIKKDSQLLSVIVKILSPPMGTLCGSRYCGGSFRQNTGKNSEKVAP